LGHQVSGLWRTLAGFLLFVCVMVYDDQGNFIGDHHWRSPDDVQDGDEMELDKGVNDWEERRGAEAETEVEVRGTWDTRSLACGEPWLVSI
jgi:hypothetical protein